MYGYSITAAAGTITTTTTTLITIPITATPPPPAAAAPATILTATMATIATVRHYLESFLERDAKYAKTWLKRCTAVYLGTARVVAFLLQ